MSRLKLFPLIFHARQIRSISKVFHDLFPIFWFNSPISHCLQTVTHAFRFDWGYHWVNWGWKKVQGLAASALLKKLYLIKCRYVMLMQRYFTTNSRSLEVGKWQSLDFSTLSIYHYWTSRKIYVMHFPRYLFFIAHWLFMHFILHNNFSKS